MSSQGHDLSAISELLDLNDLVVRMREPWKDLVCLSLPRGLTSLVLFGDQGLTSLRGLGDCCPQLVSLSLLYNQDLQGRDDVFTWPSSSN